MASTTHSPSKSLADQIDQTTLLSLLSTVLILSTAYTLSLRLLPSPNTTTKTRLLFIWHAFDALIHFILEGGYLYNCFFSWTSTTSAASLWRGKVSAYLPPNVHFLGYEGRLYGAEYGSNPLAALWREYAKADARWAGSDPTIISLELLTVFIAGPLAVWICYSLCTSATDERKARAAWFWMVVLATGEIYGGFITFAPEWLTGSPNLDTSNGMFLWLYLFFFNMLWIWIPGWVLWEAYGSLVGSGGVVEEGRRSVGRKKVE